jgi:8-oxo-dGTP diphosphatase
MGFKSLKRAAIEDSLIGTTRQYLVGNLAKPQMLDHIDDRDIEFGISDYTEAASEGAHSHSRAKEYQLILKGMTEYQDLDTGEVHRFVMGDFYVIYPGTKYIQRIKQDTRILFAKFPEGNDKISEQASEVVCRWAEEKLRVERLDLHGPNAPASNSLVPATAAAILDNENRLLLVERRDSGKWTMPGGTMEMNESLEQCIKREIREETGLDVALEGVIGTYTDPNNRVAYSDGEVRREFSIVFFCRPKNTSVSLDDESTAVRWVPIEEVGCLPVAESQKRRLDDVVDYLKTQRIFVR